MSLKFDTGKISENCLDVIRNVLLIARNVLHEELRVEGL